MKRIIFILLFPSMLYSQSNGFQGSIPISSTPIAGDVTGTLGASSVVKAQGRDIANMSPTNGQILKWISANNRWEPANETGGGATYTAGSGININGSNVISNTGDLSTTNEIQTVDQFNITSNNLNISLSSDGVSPSSVSLAPYLDNTDSQTLSVGSGNLSISGGNSVAVTTIAPLQSVDAGTGISVNTVSNVSTITNTGDTDASNDLTTSTSFAGDVSGAYNTLSVDKVKGKNVVTAGITDGQILKWNNTNNQFEPSNDLTGSTSYTAGTGIDINGSNVISNTGDLSAANEGSLTVAAGTSTTSVVNSNTSGQTGVTIEAGTGLSIVESGNTITLTNTGDGDNSSTNEIQTISASGSNPSTLTLSNSGGSVNFAGSGINAVTSSAGTITITGTETDGSVINEGLLGVGVGGASSSVILSNTSGAVGVTFESVSGVIDITESTSSNGGSITLDLPNKVTAGACSNCNLTYDAKGRITAASNGTGATDTNLGTNDLQADDNRTYDVNGFSLAMIGSTYRTIFSTAGNVGISTTAFTPLNRVHIQNTGTSAFSSASVKGITLTGNLTNQPGIAFESPDATSGARGFSWGLKSASSNALMTLKSLGDSGSDNIDNIITATSTGNVGIGTATPGYKLEVSGTGAVRIPFGTTAQRPAGATGAVRVNTTSPASLEWHDGTNWNQVQNIGLIKKKVVNNQSSTFTGATSYNLITSGAITLDANDIVKINIYCTGSGLTQGIISVLVNGNPVATVNTGLGTYVAFGLNNVTLGMELNGATYNIRGNGTHFLTNTSNQSVVVQKSYLGGVGTSAPVVIDVSIVGVNTTAQIVNQRASIEIID